MANKIQVLLLLYYSCESEGSPSPQTAGFSSPFFLFCNWVKTCLLCWLLGYKENKHTNFCLYLFLHIFFRNKVRPLIYFFIFYLFIYFFFKEKIKASGFSPNITIGVLPNVSWVTPNCHHCPPHSDSNRPSMGEQTPVFLSGTPECYAVCHSLFTNPFASSPLSYFSAVSCGRWGRMGCVAPAVPSKLGRVPRHC